MSIDTMIKLAKLPNIVGVKDASNDSIRPILLRNALNGQDFIQFSGEDPSLLSFIASGGDGIISVTANVAPNLMSEFFKLWSDGKATEARLLQERLMPLHISLFMETSPAPVKGAALLRGVCNGEVRLPLVKPTADTMLEVSNALERLQLLSKSI
jgi:4-hydroxy-tetrahydrodipicolinate synthase